jgi:hypothetical protein
MKEDGCERSGFEGGNLDGEDRIFRFKGEDEGERVWMVSSLGVPPPRAPHLRGLGVLGTCDERRRRGMDMAVDHRYTAPAPAPAPPWECSPSQSQPSRAPRLAQSGFFTSSGMHA